MDLGFGLWLLLLNLEKQLPYLQTNVSNLNMLIIIQSIVYDIVSLYQIENNYFFLLFILLSPAVVIAVSEKYTALPQQSSTGENYPQQ
jgi:hypothetical protein